MYLIERHEKILEILKEKNKVTVDEFCRIFGVSGVTLRNDLNKLAFEGKLIRTHGGAILIRKNNMSEIPFGERKVHHQNIKTNLAIAAVDLIIEGDIIFLDGSTTVASMIPFLKNKKNITIVTNSIEISYKLANLTSLDIIMTGGKLKRETYSLVSYQIDNILNEINIGKAFFSAAGFSIKEGLTDINTDEIKLRIKIIEKTKEVIALVDSTKWNKIS